MNTSTTSNTTIIDQETEKKHEKTTKEAVPVPHDIATMTRKPKRPLSAYNLFFKHQRQILLSSHGRMGFQDLARNIASKWKDVDPKSCSVFQSIASKDRIRYKKEISEWKKIHNRRSCPDKKKSSTPKKLKGTTMAKKLYHPAHAYYHVPLVTKNQASSIKPAIVSAITGSFSFGITPTSLSYVDKNTSIVMSNSYLNHKSNILLGRRSSSINSDESTTEPKPILPLYNTSLMLGKPLISDLAEKLDKDCLEVLLTSFANPLFMAEEVQ